MNSEISFFYDYESCLRQMFQKHFGVKADNVKMLPGAGSDRRYWRLSGSGLSAIGTLCADAEESRRFIHLDEVMSAQGISVPEIYDITPDYTLYLQQDCGNRSLLDAIKDDDNVYPLLEQCIDHLATMHLDMTMARAASTANPDFNEDGIINDLHYFKFCFLKPLGVEFSDAPLEEDFHHYASMICNGGGGPTGFMYRDCQSRNIMLNATGNITWIDFQGARRGPCAYDLVSFLWQAKANFNQNTKDQLLLRYAEQMHKGGADMELVKRGYNNLIPLRVMQTLGAYGFRGLTERKSHFLESITPGITNFLKCAPLLSGFKELGSLPQKVAKCWHAYNPLPSAPTHSTLTVRVESFSYRVGYPPEMHGNGGGFIFDCRYMHNPGRYEEYRQLTGLDAPVIAFLEQRGEVQQFVAECFKMVSRAIETYRRRGFNNLFIGFGCTGGQHRSVYSAEHLARAIKDIYSEVRVEVVHRRQNISYTL